MESDHESQSPTSSRRTPTAPQRESPKLSTLETVDGCIIQVCVRACVCVYHIALSGVDIVSQTLQGDPLDGQLGDGALTVIISTVDLFGEAKVCHTHRHVLIQPETHTPADVKVRLLAAGVDKCTVKSGERWD